MIAFHHANCSEIDFTILFYFNVNDLAHILYFFIDYPLSNHSATFVFHLYNKEKKILIFIFYLSVKFDRNLVFLLVV